MDLFISQFQLILSFTVPEKIKIGMGTTHVCMFSTVNHHNIILINKLAGQQNSGKNNKTSKRESI